MSKSIGNTTADKSRVRDFWDDASCGERLYLHTDDHAGYAEQAALRYELEPYILDLARFDETTGRRVLEIGVGLGADHQRFAQAGADLYGIDLTERAIVHTRHRLNLFGLQSHLAVGDAEELDFPDEFFDVVYSWGVLHHSPDTVKAIGEVHRVLKPGGSARIMIYHKWSMVGLMLWVRYALFRFRPWLPLATIYARYVESPGTKAYSESEARTLFAQFARVRITIELSHADLLEGDAGQRHQGVWLSLGRRILPRKLVKRLAHRLGLVMLIDATK